MKNQDHIAVKLGAWIKERRQKTHICAREFAILVAIPWVDYVEIEMGIKLNSHLTWKNVGKLADKLAITEQEFDTFIGHVNDVRVSPELKLSDIFDREDLRPIRGTVKRRSGEDIKTVYLTHEEEEALLDLVFKD